MQQKMQRWLVGLLTCWLMLAGVQGVSRRTVNGVPAIEIVQEKAEAQTTENFDGVTAGSMSANLPSTLHYYATDGTTNGYFQTYSGGANSAPNLLTNSVTNMVCWASTASTANANQTLDVNFKFPYAGGIAQMYWRATNQNYAQGNNYSVQVNHAGSIGIYKVVGGAGPVLVGSAIGSSATIPTGVWVHAAIVSNGTTQTVQFQRLDNSQYLTSAAAWQAGQAYAFNFTDSSVTAAGYAELLTYAPTTLGVAYDDLVHANASAAATSATLTAPSSSTPGTLATPFTWTPNGTYTGTVAISVSGGTASSANLTATSLTYSGSSAAQTFGFTPPSGDAAGTVYTLTTTPSPALGSAQTVTYTTSAALSVGTISASSSTTTSITPQVVVSGGTAPYQVQFSYSTSSGGTYTNIGSPVTVSTSGGTATSSAQSGLTASTNYYFKVSATDAAFANVLGGPTQISTQAAAAASLLGITPIVGTGPKPRTVFSDNFARQTLGTGYTIVGTGSAFTVAGNGKLNLGATGNVMQINCGQMYNPRISFETILGAHATMNVAWRASDATHNYVLALQANAATLYFRNGVGVTTPVGAALTGFNTPNGCPMHIMIDVHGQMMSLYINREYITTWQDTTYLRAGYIYLESNYDGGAVVGNEARIVRNLVISDNTLTAPTNATGTLALTGAGAGLLMQSDTSSLTNWTNEGTWATDISFPVMGVYPSPETLLWHGFPGETDGGGLREAQLTVMADGTRRLYTDFDGDGTTNSSTYGWVPGLSRSDNMLDWTKLQNLAGGLAKGDGTGNWAGRGGSGFLYKVAGTYYLNVLDAAAITGNGVPSIPYTDSWYTASSIEGPYTWTNANNVLGNTAGTYDANTASTSWILKLGSTFYNYYSALQSGSPNVYQVGLASSTNPAGPWTKIGAQLPNAMVTAIGGAVFENPKVYYSTALGRWAMQTNGLDTYYCGNRFIFSQTAANTLPVWTSATQTYTQGRASEYDGWGANGVMCPFLNEDGTVRIQADGSLGMVYDGNAGMTDTNVMRSILQGELRPSASAFTYNDTSGSAGTQKTVSASLSHTDLTAEFLLGFSASSGSCSFEFRRGAGVGDAASCVRLNLAYNAAPTITVWNGTTTTATYTASSALNRFALTNTLANQSGTVEYNRVKLVAVGSHIQAFLDGCLVLDCTDSTYLSGSYIGFRAFQTTCSVRQLNISAANQVTITGLLPEQEVTLRGSDDVVLAKAKVPYGSTSVTLHSRHWPVMGVSVDGQTTYQPAGGIWGGDTLAATVTPVTSTTKVIKPSRQLPRNSRN